MTRAIRSLRTAGLAALAAHAFAGAAPAQTLADYDYEYLRFRGVGADIGYIWATKVTNTQQYSLRLDLGYLGPGVRIIPSISYWQSRLKQEELDDLATRLGQQTGATIDGGDLGPIEWSDLSLSVDGQFVWNTPINVLTFVGGGLGFHALNGQGDAVDDTFVEDLLDDIAVGASALAGVEFEPVDRLRVYAEGRYTAMNSLQYLSARAGLQFMFFPDRSVEVGAVVPAPRIQGEAP